MLWLHRAISCVALFACLSVHADEAALLRVAPVPGSASTYRVVVEVLPGTEAPVIAGVSFALAIPATVSDLTAGPSVWTDAPVAPIQAVTGGLLVGAVLTAAHDLSGGSCEVVRFSVGSVAGIGFVEELAGVTIRAVVSTVDSVSLSPYTRVLDGGVLAPEPSGSASEGASAAADSPSASGEDMAMAAPQGEGEGALGSVLPCDAVEIVVEMPEADLQIQVPGDFDEIHEAVDSLNGTGRPIVVIEVGPSGAVPYEPVFIDLQLLETWGVAELYVLSTDGPGLTHIQGNQPSPSSPVPQPPLRIVGNPTTAITLGVGRVAADTADLTNHSDWFGFRLLGASPPTAAGGTRIENCNNSGASRIELRGNEFVDTVASASLFGGGGLRVLNALGVVIARNEIGNNTLAGALFGGGIVDGDGAGLYIASSEVVALSNWIHGNGFPALNADFLAQGGGIALFSGSLDLCGNRIEENQAKVGAGVWAHIRYGSIFGTPVPARFYARENYLRLNEPWEPPLLTTPNGTAYRGPGIHVDTDVGIDDSYILQILSNIIEENVISTAVAQPPGVPAEVGGGAYLGLKLSIAGGAGTNNFPAFESNLVRLNRAEQDGGGVWALAERLLYGQIEYLRFDNNTLLLNQLDAASGDRGSGVFFAGEGSMGLGVLNLHSGINNVSFENESTLGLIQAFVECPNNSDPWDYSQMEGPQGSGCPSPTGWNLGAGIANSAADPLFRRSFGLLSTGRISESSPCVDSGALGNPLSSTDIDGEDRVVDHPLVSGVSALDRGADEVVAFVFLRADANNDAILDISDAAHINGVVAGAAPPIGCEDAFDSNNDGQVDIADVVYLLAFLFQSGSPPPAPYPSCGLDPPSAGDRLLCEHEMVCP